MSGAGKRLPRNKLPASVKDPRCSRVLCTRAARLLPASIGADQFDGIDFVPARHLPGIEVNPNT